MTSIRALIFSRLALVVVAYLTLTVGVGYGLLRHVMTEFVVTDAAASLDFVISNITSNYETQLQPLARLATLDGLSPYDAATAARQIQVFLALNPLFGTVHVYRADGTRVLAERRSDILPYALERNFRERPDAAFIRLAEQVLQTGRAALSETFRTSTGDLLQTYVVPLHDGPQSRRVTGLLSGGVFPHQHHLNHLVAGLTLAPGNLIVISDLAGNRIVASGVASETVRQTLQPHVVAAVAAADAHPDATAPLITRTPAYVFLSRPIPALKLVATLGINTAQLREKQSQLARYGFVLAMIGFVLSLGAAVLIGNRLSRPFVAIAAGLRRLTLGDFTTPVAYQGGDEIGQVASLVDNLAAKLDKDRYLGELWSTDEEAEALDAQPEPR